MSRVLLGALLAAALALASTTGAQPPTTGVRLTCFCPELPNHSVTCLATHKLALQAAFCLQDEATCEKCLYDNDPLPDTKGKFVCNVTCEVKIGADGLPHSASCENISKLIPFTCQKICYYSTGFYGSSTPAPVVSPSPIVPAATPK